MPQHSEAAVRDAVFWFDRKAPPLPSLDAIATADVVVVGGGMMGLMCARTLAARGVNVAVVEADTCGEGATGRSSGFITPDSELEFHDLVEQFGPDQARRLWEFARDGGSLIRAAVESARIECDLRVQDGLFVASSRRAADTVAKEHAARVAAGFGSTLLGATVLPGVLGGKNYFAGLRFADTFGLDAYRCCVGLRRSLEESGVRVFERSPVTRLSLQGIETAAGAIRAEHVVVCTDRLLPALGLARHEMYHAQTFLAVSEPLDEVTVAGMFPDGEVMVWDSELIYQYFRMIAGRRLLIGGGTLLSTYSPHERHRPAEVARRLSCYLARHFPGLRVRFAAAWPGRIGISKDFAPVIGRHPHLPRIHFAGGAAGLPWAAALGRYLAEKILDGRSELDVPLAVDRAYAIGAKATAVIGRRAAFALSHGIAKL